MAKIASGLQKWGPLSPKNSRQGGVLGVNRYSVGKSGLQSVALVRLFLLMEWVLQ